MCTQPCYFGGPFALNWASDDAGLLEISETILAQRMRKRGIAARYYTPAVQKAAFALPGYVAKAISGAGAHARQVRGNGGASGRKSASKAATKR